MSAGGSTKVVITALVTNLAIALSKFVGAYFSKSTALLAEGIHSLVDCANQLLLLWGAKRSARPPTKNFPLGFGREMFFWSFMVAIFLFSLGGLFAIYEGYHKLSSTEPHAEVQPLIGIVILLFGVVMETFSFMACLKEVKTQSRYPNLWVWFRRTTSADLLVIFTEDLAALMGLSVALLSAVMVWITGNSIWDAWGSIGVGVILVIVAALLSFEIKSLLIGEAPTQDFETEIQKIVQVEIPGSKVLKLIAIQTGSNEVMVSYKITPGQSKSVKELIDKINLTEQKVRLRFPEIRWQFVEPDYEV